MELISNDEVTLTARRTFGIKYLYPWQRLVIANILDAAKAVREQQNTDTAGTDDAPLNRGRQIVLLPTGAGKSLCFLVPALMLKGPTLVLYPLLALMADQEKRMAAGNIDCVTFRGRQTAEEREQNFRRIHSGTVRVILANPEVLQNQSLIKQLSQCGIEHIAIDEAHCVSEWGDSFRPAYLTVGTIITALGVKTVTAFTATASPQVLSRIAEVLFAGEAHLVRSDSDRPNIHYSVQNAYDKKKAVLSLASKERLPLIVFCGTRRRAEDLSRELRLFLETKDALYPENAAHTEIRFYHAGLEHDEKKEIENWFIHNPEAPKILCCTCAFGMGVDAHCVRTVIHYDVPQYVESYVQESGRAGRDGSDAKAILLWSPDDSARFRAFMPGTRSSVMGLFAESTTCRRQILLDALGGEQAVCSGCDVCERRQIQEQKTRLQTGRHLFLQKTAAVFKVSNYLRSCGAPPAEDASLALRLFHFHPRSYTADEAAAVLAEAANRKTVTNYGLRIWSSSDWIPIITELKKTNQIRTCGRLWKGKLTPVR